MTSSAPKSEPTTTPEVSPAPTRALLARATKLIGAWKRGYKLLKPLEAKVDAARKLVVDLLVDAGLQGIVTKHGELNLQTKTTTNWEALARAVIAPKFIEQLVPQFTTKSDPYLRGLTRWSAE